MATPEEITSLKAQWCADSCWDLETTEGFEEHKDELLAYRLKKEATWEQARHDKVVVKAEGLGIADHLELAEYIMALERRIVKLENRAVEYLLGNF